MELLNYLNSHKDWQTTLSKSPYNLNFKFEGPYCIFKYNLIESTLTLPLCREARGSIFRQDFMGNWKCVCRALDKFGNFGEEYADTYKIDWSNVSIQEKIDGSIIKCWHDQGLWHVSTNNTIDAFQAECGNTTYGDLFYSIIQKHTPIADFFAHLNTGYTYWFEMVHPLNTIVVHYSEPAIYYLGRRNMSTLEEHKVRHFITMKWIKYPKIFHYHSLEECLAAAHKMGEDEEGYVVCATKQKENDSYLRIKVKGDEYLKRHRIRGNGPITTSKIISLWQEDLLDDFLAYFPENQEFVKNILQDIHNLCGKAEIAYEAIKSASDRRDFAKQAKSYIKPIQSYLFARLDNKTSNAIEYFKTISKKNLTLLLEKGN